MAQPQKKRDLADIFKPYARERFLLNRTIPQKRPSPPAIDQVDGSPDLKRATSPRRSRHVGRDPISTPSTPQAPSFSSLTTPPSGSLPIRTPQSRRPQATPPVTYTSGRLFATSSHAPDTNANSFVSNSRISAPEPSRPTAPAPSTLPPSTQSVVRQGKVVAIRDSDEDDSDSIASLNDIFGRRREDDEGSKSSPPDVDEEEDEEKREAGRVSMLRLFTNGRSDPLINKQKMREIMGMKKSQMMNKYISQQSEYVKARETTTQTRELYKNNLLTLEKGASNGDLLTTFQEYLGANEADAEKLLGAVRRTDALAKDKSFSFFKAKGLMDSEQPQADAVDFPAHAVPHNLFRSYDDEARSRAFLSGFTADLASQGAFHERALDWCFKTLPTEEDVKLQHAYLQCLRKGAEHWAWVNVTALDVQSCFEKLGADHASINLNTPLVAKPQPHDPTRTSRKVESLCLVLEMLQSICPHMAFDALSMLCSMLCRIAIDQPLMSESKITDKVESLFQDLLGGTLNTQAAGHVASHMITDMTANLHEPALQASLLDHLMPITRLQRSVRITLAHAFLLGARAPPSTYDPASIAITELSALTTLLNTSDDYATARLRTTLNYADLRDRAIILDVAISDGGKPASFPSPEYASAKAFNQVIDTLAAALRKTIGAIADTGAVHMKRTEAKEKLDCVYHRLLYAVRTEPPPRKHIFDQHTGKIGDGDDVRAVARGRDAMQSFLARVKQDQIEGRVKAESVL